MIFYILHIFCSQTNTHTEIHIAMLNVIMFIVSLLPVIQLVGVRVTFATATINALTNSKPTNTHTQHTGTHIITALCEYYIAICSIIIWLNWKTQWANNRKSSQAALSLLMFVVVGLRNGFRKDCMYTAKSGPNIIARTYQVAPSSTKCSAMREHYMYRCAMNWINIVETDLRQSASIKCRRSTR